MIAIYARVSTTEQAERGYSIEGQIEKCIKKAGTTEVIKYVDEGFSGELLSRPGMNRLRQDIKDGLITKVVCYDPDRLSRNLMNQLIIDREIRSQGVDMQFVNGEYANTSEGHLFFSMRGAIAEFEKAKIKERTSGGRLSKAKKGKVVKDNKLYGYTYDKEKSTYTINEKEAKFVRMIFDYYTDPSSPFKGINGIAVHLQEIGAPTKKGAKVWHRQVVRQILMNEAYTGVYYQNRYDTEGDYVRRQAGEKIEYRFRPKEQWVKSKIPAIISEEQFEYAQQLLDQGRRRYTKDSHHQYLLSGLVRCGRCGETMPGRKRKSHGKDYFVYECRKNYAGAKSKGCGKQMSENKINSYIWDSVIDLLTNPEKIKEFRGEEEKTYLKDELEHLQQEIEKTKKGRKRLFTLVSLSEEDDLDLEEIKDQIRELQLKEKDLQSKYNQLQDELKPTKNEHSETAFEAALNMYLINKEKEFSFEQKQQIIRTVVKEVVIIDSQTVSIHTF
jgi:site-specific DNA recombinase